MCQVITGLLLGYYWVITGLLLGYYRVLPGFTEFYGVSGKLQLENGCQRKSRSTE